MKKAPNMERFYLEDENLTKHIDMSFLPTSLTHLALVNCSSRIPLLNRHKYMITTGRIQGGPHQMIEFSS